MGDLNMGPDRAAALTGMSSAGSHLTFPGSAPREQLDHILVEGGRPRGVVRRPPMDLSDHRALVAELELLGQPGT